MSKLAAAILTVTLTIAGTFGGYVVGFHAGMRRATAVYQAALDAQQQKIATLLDDNGRLLVKLADCTAIIVAPPFLGADAMGDIARTIVRKYLAARPAAR